jgi:hypothetical protein
MSLILLYIFAFPFFFLPCFKLPLLTLHLSTAFYAVSQFLFSFFAYFCFFFWHSLFSFRFHILQDLGQYCSVTTIWIRHLILLRFILVNGKINCLCLSAGSCRLGVPKPWVAKTSWWVALRKPERKNWLKVMENFAGPLNIFQVCLKKHQLLCIGIY